MGINNREYMEIYGKIVSKNWKNTQLREAGFLKLSQNSHKKGVKLLAIFFGFCYIQDADGALQIYSGGNTERKRTLKTEKSLIISRLAKS